ERSGGGGGGQPSFGMLHGGGGYGVRNGGGRRGEALDGPNDCSNRHEDGRNSHPLLDLDTLGRFEDLQLGAHFSDFRVAGDGLFGVLQFLREGGQFRAVCVRRVNRGRGVSVAVGLLGGLHSRDTGPHETPEFGVILILDVHFLGQDSNLDRVDL